MGFADVPAETEAQQILFKLDMHEQQLVQLTAALNGLGENVQWIVDNVQGIFQMFSSPAFMTQMMGAFNGGVVAAAAADTGPESESESESASTVGG
jgi:hypothetical protein